MDEELKKKLQQHIYYFIIALLSLLVVIIGPMIGSYIDGVGARLPDTPLGWVIWAFNNIFVGIIGIFILYSFNKQAELNVADDPKKQEADKLLASSNVKEHKIISYEEYKRNVYIKKGITVFFTSVFSVFAIGEAVLTYDYIRLIAYATTITMQIAFGILQMKATELYLTTDYYIYALSKKESNNNISDQSGDLITVETIDETLEEIKERE